MSGDSGSGFFSGFFIGYVLGIVTVGAFIVILHYFR